MSGGPPAHAPFVERRVSSRGRKIRSRHREARFQNATALFMNVVEGKSCELRMYGFIGTFLLGSEAHLFGERAELGKLSSIRDFP